MYRKLSAFVCCLLLSGSALSQLFYKGGNYYDFLRDPDQSYTRMVGAGMSWRAMPFEQNFKSIGLSQQMHVNLARLVSGKFVLGVELDIRGGKGFTHKRFETAFGETLADGRYDSYSSLKDSALANGLVNAVQGSNICRGNYFGDIGLMFSPFPYKWGGVVLFWKRGYRYYPTFISSAYFESESDDWDYVTLQLKKVHTLEVRVHPALLFRQQEIGIGKVQDYIYVSFFAEWKNARQMSFNGVALDQLFKPEAIDAAFQQRSFGIKAGIWLR